MEKIKRNPKLKREMERLDFEAKRAVIRGHFEKFDYACTKTALLSGGYVHPKQIRELWEKKRKQFLELVEKLKNEKG